MLTLVIGGAASGKSAFAESLCMQSPLPRTYLATMQVWDAECAARVARHRAMRQQKQFATVECPRGLEAIALPQRGTVLLRISAIWQPTSCTTRPGRGRPLPMPCCGESKRCGRSVRN